MTTVRRITEETDVTVTLSVGASDPKVSVSTGEPLVDHMITTSPATAASTSSSSRPATSRTT